TLEQGRNFNNKMWNALKLVKMWEGKQVNNSEQTANSFALAWFENRLNEAKAELTTLVEQFRLSEALKVIYSLIWDDFCSWYLEWVKPGFEQPIDAGVYNKTIEYFTELMQLLHPFMPFVTEEIYHQLADRSDDLCGRKYEAAKATDKTILANAAVLKDVITGLRDVRNKQQIKPKETIALHIQTENAAVYKSIETILAKQVNAKAISFVNDAVANSIACVIGKDKFYFETEQPMDTGKQKADMEKELAHLKGFLISVEKKLGNEKFVGNAKPEVIALEQKKKADAEEKIKIIEDSLSKL
ncbi:MAG TPA: class I tRNA ligase family protein, partial [Chitinophagaceae bacterium]|nr:class I tRNA ligase family protein [Chitinophagaceae bacterium]